MDDLIVEILEMFRQAVQGVTWESAAIPFEVADGATPSGVAYYADADGNRGDVFLDVWRCVDIAHELTSSLSASTGTEVRRVRVNVASDWSTTIDHFGPRPDPDDISQHFGVWPDEAGYDGPVFVRPEINKVDAPEYRLIAGSARDATDALARIGAWLTANEPDYAAMLNPPATTNDLDQLEQDLAVVLPASVRQAWLTHNGQNGRGLLQFRWLPVAESAEKLPFFSSRADRGKGFIPILETDGIIGFVESVDQPGQDGPLWLYEHNDERLADSFGHYLAWFADQCEAGNITGEIFDFMLVHVDHV